MSVETLSMNNEFDQTPEREKLEVEKKFNLIEPFFFDFLKQQCEVKTIEQLYVSHPNDEFSLRLRETISPNGTVYSAALKERGKIAQNGIERLETPTFIDKSAFDFYKEQDVHVILTKQRVEPVPGVTIDWINGWDQPIVEIEDIATNEEAQFFYQIYRDQLIDRSGESMVDNEYIAHMLSGRNPESSTSGELDPRAVADEILAYRRAGVKNMVVGISGRSGSGKTTLANQVERLLQDTGNQNITVARVSTDDYHLGKAQLDTINGSPWENWDAPEVYDTKTLAFDLWSLLQGEAIDKRYFDFVSQEPRMGGEVHPADIIIVEGIHAGSQDLAKIRQLHFNLGVPLATCVGRDLERIRSLGRANDSISTPEQRLRYQIEIAEPTYLALEMPRRNSWSASMRPVGAAALKTTE